MTRVGDKDLSLKIFTIERVTNANEKEKTTNLVLEGIARLHDEWRMVDSSVWEGGDTDCHLEMWGLRSILGLKEFHAQSGKNIYSMHDWKIYMWVAMLIRIDTQSEWFRRKLTKHSWGWPAVGMVHKFKRQPAARVNGWRPTTCFFKHIAQISKDAQTYKEHAHWGQERATATLIL